jgi:hypothetical protein
MWRKIVALGLALALPSAASAGPLKESAEKAGKELALAQTDVETRSRSRFWTGIALIAGGGALAVLGSVELGDDETGPDDGEDLNGSDDGEDSDGWGNKALLGSGLAAAIVGGVLLMTGRKGSSPSVSMGPGKITVHQTVRF